MQCIGLKKSGKTCTANFDKLNYLSCLRIIPDGKCAWIGASNVNNKNEYRWIELPPNYNQSHAHGKLLTETYTNFLSDILFEQVQNFAICASKRKTKSIYCTLRNRRLINLINCHLNYAAWICFKIKTAYHPKSCDMQVYQEHKAIETEFVLRLMERGPWEVI